MVAFATRMTKSSSYSTILIMLLLNVWTCLSPSKFVVNGLNHTGLVGGDGNGGDSRNFTADNAVSVRGRGPFADRGVAPFYDPEVPSGLENLPPSEPWSLPIEAEKEARNEPPPTPSSTTSELSLTATPTTTATSSTEEEEKLADTDPTSLRGSIMSHRTKRPPLVEIFHG